MRLALLRHGQAEAQMNLDAERALTPEGIAEVRATLARLDLRPYARILVSPYRRAQQTAALVRTCWPQAPLLETVPWLVPNTAPQDVLAQLPEVSVMLVAHQPLLGALAALLLQGARSALHLQTGTCLVLEGEAFLPGLMSRIALPESGSGAPT